MGTLPARPDSEDRPITAPTPLTQNRPTDDTAAADLRNRLFFRLYQTANLLNKTGTRALEQHGVTTQQWAILGALADRRSSGGISVGDLTQLLMVSRQNLTGVLARLEARGLIQRMVDEQDKRSRVIGLTDKGRQTWADMQPQIADFYSASLSGFSSADISAAMHYLEDLRRNFIEVERAQGESTDRSAEA
ncbi:MarR family transcriptional regulator [uncultured Paracoccus sp.]|uniref:MarR family winged helix-turn-helix transcriptional regulator n=1 Tax=uncultured Paracoccus sp. TaxID=189685 RepID=UPI002638E905|nr:MarR family transcriptional regulator [uncultured Paracoccus sp.]